MNTPSCVLNLTGLRLHPTRGAGRRRPALGFTLVELMVTVAILAIMMAIAVPSLQNLLNGNRLEGKASELASAIRLARMEAMKRGPGARVTVTPNTASTWTAGWTVFVDDSTDANGGVSPAGASVLQVTEALPSSVTVSSGALGYVSFVASGDAMVTKNDAPAAKATGGYQRGVIRLVSGAQSRCIKIIPPGQVDVVSNAANCP